MWSGSTVRGNRTTSGNGKMGSWMTTLMTITHPGRGWTASSPESAYMMLRTAPPSTWMVAPVMYRASRIALRCSSGIP